MNSHFSDEDRKKAIWVKYMWSKNVMFHSGTLKKFIDAKRKGWRVPV